MSYEYQPVGYWPTNYWPTSYWPSLVTTPVISDIAYPVLVSAYGLRFATTPIVGHVSPLNSVAPLLGAAVASILAGAVSTALDAPLLAGAVDLGHTASKLAQAPTTTIDSVNSAKSVTTGVAHD